MRRKPTYVTYFTLHQIWRKIIWRDCENERILARKIPFPTTVHLIAVICIPCLLHYCLLHTKSGEHDYSDNHVKVDDYNNNFSNDNVRATVKLDKLNKIY